MPKYKLQRTVTCYLVKKRNTLNGRKDILLDERTFSSQRIDFPNEIRAGDQIKIGEKKSEVSGIEHILHEDYSIVVLSPLRAEGDDSSIEAKDRFEKLIEENKYLEHLF